MGSPFDQLAKTTQAGFLTQFGESASYWVASLALQKNLTAIVNREPLEPLDDGGVQYGRVRYTVLLAHDDTVGVLREDMTVNQDVLEFKQDLSDTDETCFRVITVDGPEGGLLTVGVVADA
jgi:hypothetical protein